MRFDIEKMMARAAECENQSMYIECALTGVMVDYYFTEFTKSVMAQSGTSGTPSPTMECDIDCRRETEKETRVGKRSAVDGGRAALAPKSGVPKDFVMAQSGTSSPLCDSSVCSERSDVTPHPTQVFPLHLTLEVTRQGEGNNPGIRISKKHRAVEIQGCRVFFIRFDDVIKKRKFDDGGVIWDYIVEEDE